MSKSKCSGVKSLIQDCSYKNDFIPLCNGKQTLWIVPKKLSSLKKWIWCSFEKHNIQHWEIANKDRLTCSASCIFATFLQLFHKDFKFILKEHFYFYKPITWNISVEYLFKHHLEMVWNKKKYFESCYPAFRNAT